MTESDDASCTVFVGNLSPDTTEDEVSRLFSRCGTVLSCTIPHDQRTGRSKFIAFVRYQDSASANNALKFIHGVELNGRPLRVTTTKPFKGRHPPPAPYDSEYAPNPHRSYQRAIEDRLPRSFNRFEPFERARPLPRLWDDEPSHQNPVDSEWPASRVLPRVGLEYEGRQGWDELQKAFVRELVDRAAERRSVEDAIRMVLEERRSTGGRPRVPEDSLVDLIRSLT
jgi:hypothetical protein